MSNIKSSRLLCILYIILAILWAVCCVLNTITVVISFSVWVLITAILDFFLAGSSAYVAFYWHNAAKTERGNDNE